VTPRVPRGGEAPNRRPGARTPVGVRDLPAPVRTSQARRASIPPGGSEGSTCPVGAGTGAGLPLEGSSTHRIQCGWLRRALPPRHVGQPLSGLTVDRVLPRYTVSRLRRTRAELVCCINWIRRHGTFPSCRLRRKLRGPFSYVAGDAASYAWRRSDKTAPGHAERGIPGAGKEIQECDLLYLQRHNL
jgi:hypothetical protein